MAGFIGAVGDAKSRTIVILIGMVILVGVGVMMVGRTASEPADIVGQSRASNVARNIESIPGAGDPTEEYVELATEKNIIKADEALVRGTSAIPSLIKQDDDAAARFAASLGKRGREVEEAPDPSDLYRQQLERQQALYDQHRQYEKQLLQERTDARRSQQDQASLLAAAQSLLGAWVPPSQSYSGSGVNLDDYATRGVLHGPKPSSASPRTRSNRDLARAADAGALVEGVGTGQALAAEVALRAGDILFAVMDTSINTDYESPVMARIVEGPLAGARIMGSVERQNKLVKVSFNLITLPNAPSSSAFDAVAIDPNTARMAIATGVDNHYVLRYGTFMASTFLAGMGDAAKASASSPEVSVNDSGVVSVTNPEATFTELLLSGLGEVGKRWAENVNQLDKPPTVTVDAGTGIGLLVLSDLQV